MKLCFLLLLMALRVSCFPSYINCDLTINKAANLNQNIMTTTNNVMGATPLSEDAKLGTISQTVCAGNVIPLDLSAFYGTNGGQHALLHVTNGVIASTNGVASPNTCANNNAMQMFEFEVPAGLTWSAPTQLGSVTFSAFSANGYEQIRRATVTIQVIAQDPTNPACVTAPTPPPTPIAAILTSECDAYEKSVVLKNNFRLCWTRTQISTRMMTVRSGTGTNQWLGIGIGKTMINSIVAIGSTSRNGDSTAVTTHTIPANGKSQTAWTSQLSTSVFTGRAFESTNGEFLVRVTVANENLPEISDIIVATGSLGTTVGYSAHAPSSRLGVSVNFVTGETKKQPMPAALIVHAVLMFLAWGVLIPTGVTMAKCGKKRFPPNQGSDSKPEKSWFDYHKYIQMSAVVIGSMIAFPIGLSQGSKTNIAHMVIGIMVSLLGLFQPLNGRCRPHKKDEPYPRRTYWEWLHKGTGYTASLFGIINIIIGLVIVSKNY